MDAIAHFTEQLIAAEPWWLIAALVVLSRGPSWIRDWVAAVWAIRALREPSALTSPPECSKRLPR